jgi:uncharacterized protein YegJ (DUF2314 family)
MRIWLVVLVGLSACRRPATPAQAVTPAIAPSPAALSKPAPVGSLFERVAICSFGVYHLSRPATPPKQLARKLAADAGFKVVDSMPEERSKAPLALILTPSTKEAPPPSLESLKYRAHGLSPEDGERLQHADSLTVVSFVAPAPGLDKYRAALGVAHQLAQKSGGLIFDASTGAVFTPKAFVALLEDWSGDLPDLRRHVVLDFYREEELARIVSLGMEKFGLPDVAVSQLTLHDSESMGSLVNVVLQTMLERGALVRAGELDLSLPQLRSASMKKEMIASFKKGATGVSTVRLAIATPEKGDADNRLLELVFPGPSESLQVRHSALLQSFFGSADKLIHTDEDDEELLAASRRAKKAFAKLKPKFSPRPPELEHLMVKAPFTTTSGGTEWMWIEVVRWEGTRLEGILESEPYEVKGLKAGARVEAQEDAIFDYILRHADGKSEGNETGKIFDARGAAN